jgi:chromosome partitioning protein
MTYAIAVAQRKGGVGKTTVAVNVAAEFQRRWQGVGLIDADVQESAAQWAEPGNLQFPVYTLALADQPIADWIGKFNRVAASHEYVVIDTAPNERALVASIAVSHLVLVPCTPSGLDIEATARTLKIIEKVCALRQRQPNLIIVPNRVDSRTLEGRQLVDELSGLNETVSSTIGNRSAFVRAFSAGHSVAGMSDADAAHHEVQVLCDLVENSLGIKRRSGKA